MKQLLLIKSYPYRDTCTKNKEKFFFVDPMFLISCWIHPRVLRLEEFFPLELTDFPKNKSMDTYYHYS